MVIARYFGARDQENVEKAVHTTVAFGIVASVILTIVGVIFCTSDFDMDENTGKCHAGINDLFPRLLYGIRGICYVQYVCWNSSGRR